MKTIRMVGVATAMVGVLVAAAAWQASRLDNPLPPPLVPRDALPPLPAAQDNGWTQIAEVELRDTKSCNEAMGVLRVVGEDTEASDFWEEALEARDALDTCLRARKRGIRAWERAADAPTFVLRNEHGRATFHAHNLFETIVLVAVGHATWGRWEDADRVLAEHLGMMAQALESTTNAMAAVIAAHGLELGLEVAYLLAQKHGWSDFPQVAERVRAMDDGPVPYAVLGQLELGAYFRSRDSIERVRDSLSGAARWSFDPVHSAQLMDARLTQFWRSHGGVVLGTSDDPGDDASCGWAARLHNNHGCALYGPSTWDQSTTEDVLQTSHEVRTRWLRRLADSLQRAEQ